jgi:hypothetical protein
VSFAAATTTHFPCPAGGVDDTLGASLCFVYKLLLGRFLLMLFRHFVSRFSYPNPTQAIVFTPAVRLEGKKK